MNGAMPLDHPLFLEGFRHLIVERENLLRRDVIEDLACLILAGNLLDLKKRLRIAARFVLLHRCLIGQERGRLRKEHTQGAGGAFEIGLVLGGLPGRK